MNSGVISVTARAETPEQTAMSIAEDLSEFMDANGITSMQKLHATETEIMDANGYMNYVHTLVITYGMDDAPRIHNVPATRETQRLDPRETRRLRPLPTPAWSARELQPYHDAADSLLLAHFLGCAEPLVAFLVAPLYGVFEHVFERGAARDVLRMISADREDAIATVTTNNSPERYS